MNMDLEEQTYLIIDDGTSLGRARSMTKTLEKKGLDTSIKMSANSEFSDIVNRLKELQEQWRLRKVNRKVPIINVKYVQNDDFNKEDDKHKVMQLTADKKELTQTVSMLFKEMQHLKEQNENMAGRIETFRKVLHETKSYSIILKKTNDNLAADMDFESDLHEKQKRIWKSKLRNESSDNIDNLLKEFELTIQTQREQIKFKNEHLEQLKSVYEHEKDELRGELQREIYQVRNHRQQQIEEIKMKMEQLRTELERSKMENQRLLKELEFSNQELNANKKLMEASKPMNAAETEKQLFRLERDYLTLSEMLVTLQHKVTEIGSDLDSKQRELDDANRLIDEQNKSLEEYKKAMQLLRANLNESKSDQSDLINALQQEWEQCKEELIKTKENRKKLEMKRNDLMTELEELQIVNAMNQSAQQSNGYGYASPTSDNEEKKSDPEMVVLVHDLQSRCNRLENETKSQQMLMQQLMNQQKIFQKRNKALVQRLKQIKKGGGGGNMNMNLNMNEGGDMDMTGSLMNLGLVPEHVIIDLKSLYDHYVRNPVISANEMILRIEIITSKVTAQNGKQINDFVVPDFKQMRINSANAILQVVEDILYQRQTAINNELLKIKEIDELRKNNNLETGKLSGELRKRNHEMKVYRKQFRAYEEQALQTSHGQDELFEALQRMQKENERIAEEFLQGANVWNSEKAIMNAERTQIENDVSYLAYNLENLILERMQFEQEADEFQGLYMNLIAHLREKGMQIEIAYVDENDRNIPSKYAENRRKRAVANKRLKLYQTSTQAATNEAMIDDSLNNYDSMPSGNAILSQESASFSSMKRRASDSKGQRNGKSYAYENNADVGMALKRLKSDPVRSKFSEQRNRKRSLVQKMKPSDQLLGVSDFFGQDELMNYEIGNKKMSPVGKGNNIVFEDQEEADDYILFDEPDAFNLLDNEYLKLAMKFVDENNSMLSSIQAVSGDQSVIVQEILSEELKRKEAALPVLEGWVNKKSPTGINRWQKRWVIVREYNIFYSKKQCDIKDTKNAAERKKFLNAIPLLVVQYVVVTDQKNGRKFELVARDPRTGDRRHYQWRCQTREETTKWVDGLKQHKKMLNARLQFLAHSGETKK